MHPLVSFLLCLLALYAAFGLIAALAFVAFGVTRVQPAPMSVGFKAVQWNRRKLVYDAILLAGVVLFIGAFMTIGALRKPPADMPAWINLRIKAFGACAFTMLTIILMIGPLARLDRRFLPLLYNRRHFGVLTFLVALVVGLGFTMAFILRPPPETPAAAEPRR